MDFKIIRENALLNDSNDEKELAKNYKIITNAFRQLELIDTKNVEPSDFPYKLDRTFLREDEVDNNNYDDFKKNVKLNKDSYVVINGVKNE